MSECKTIEIQLFECKLIAKLFWPRVKLCYKWSKCISDIIHLVLGLFPKEGPYNCYIEFFINTIGILSTFPCFNKLKRFLVSFIYMKNIFKEVLLNFFLYFTNFNYPITVYCSFKLKHFLVNLILMKNIVFNEGSVKPLSLIPPQLASISRTCVLLCSLSLCLSVSLSFKLNLEKKLK